jgi:hypothetical protein
MFTGTEMCCATGNCVDDKEEGDWRFLCNYRVYKDQPCVVYRHVAGKRVKAVPCDGPPWDTCGCSAFIAEYCR